MRQVVEGIKDKIITGVLLKPPKGGAAALKFSGHLSQLEGIKLPGDEVAKAFEEWVESTKVLGGHDPRPSGSNGGLSPEGSGVQTTEGGPVSEQIAAVRVEVAQMAKELRTAYVAIVPTGATVLATQQLITGSSVYQSANDTGAHRLCFVYVVPCSWDMPKLATRRNSRRARPVPVLPEDLGQFADVIDRMVTAESESYACIFMGRASRSGAGMAVEAGVSAESQVINIVRDKTKGNMRVKRFRLAYAGTNCMVKRGIGSGTMTESMFFFYRGSWASKRIPGPRTHFGGSTWDDCWNDIPVVDNYQQFEVPYSLKEIVFDDLWSSRAAPLDADTIESSGEEQEAIGGQAPKSAHDDDDDGKKAKAKKGSKKARDTKSKKKAEINNNAESKRKAESKKQDDGKKNKKAESKKQADDKKGKKPGSPKRKHKQQEVAKMKKARLLVAQPEIMATATDKESEPLFHNDYHGTVWSQVCKEWDAKGCVLWTPANGTAAVQAVHDGRPLLCLASNPQHAELLMYFVDCALASAIQVSICGRFHRSSVVFAWALA